MKHRFAAFLGILALAACADAPTTRTAAGAGPSLAAAPATDVMAVVTPSGLVEVSWAHDGAEVTRWVLYRRPVGQVSWQTVKATYDVRVRRLSDSRYNVNVDGWQWMVCAFTGNTCTPSAVVTATGLRLTAPDYVQVVENSPEAVTLTWSRGDGP
ncbi:MAG TPA: hypothetical protein VFQ45_11815, partial [Longimicrobium sp.]|nr:hypothetical protein [Longimicrobium sp.]